ncbi:MAG: prepilin-type N-terminal cleavage/methylation domain-containing protein [Candidatus Zixiibacteriota bacterium]
MEQVYSIFGKRGQKGLTLLEVLISMVVLSIGLLGLAPMMKISIDSNSVGNEFSQASRLAMDKIHGYEADTIAIVIPVSATESNILGKFSRSTSIIDSTVDATVPAGLNLIEVSIAWTDQTGQSQTVTQSTYLQK